MYEPHLASSTVIDDGRPWYSTLTRYHWFVLTVAALGWLFDTMDQQLFNLARVPAMKELLRPSPDVAAPQADVDFYAGVATSIFLIGWATGGLFFGVLGDRIGRAKTMLLTILLYSLFTGLSAFSYGIWDFALWRFLTGLGVGGEFAVGVALVAEAMPDRARPYALALLQALSAVGNITAAIISIFLGQLEQSGAVGQAWRWMFVIGTVPALLAILIRRRLKEPERWEKAAHEPGAAVQQLGSVQELFTDPRWRRRALVGVVLASAGVIGLWGIGFFSVDLNRSVFRKNFQNEARAAGAVDHDRLFVQLALASPDKLPELRQLVKAPDLLGANTNPQSAKLPEQIYNAALKRHDAGQTVSSDSVTAALTAENPEWGAAAAEYLAAPLPSASVGVDALAQQIRGRTANIAGRLTLWAGVTSMMLNIGAFFGIYLFGIVSQRIGRRPTFAISFVLALASTALVFWTFQSISQVFWMIPLMGFCQLSLFGGYAVYFPELFPTRLRSTGTSFCYNVGRFLAAAGPFTLGYLTSQVFSVENGYEEPMRYAGVAMCGIFLIGLLALPFAPETKGQPLPE
ncbi:MAG: MFS transporter [Planctomycetaceae bacterium]|nr:MFS transporter [Planctomycetaceae bacterium]